MRKLAASLGLVVAFLLAGCSTGTVPDGATVMMTPTAAVQGAQGVVYGGEQPVTGATIQLWSVGTTGYGSAGTALASTTTGSNGSFSITGLYTCPAGDPYVYLTATGGNPGLTLGTNNTAISLVAALTDCNTLKANAATTFIVINEVTTVASAYALAQFINPATGSIGSYGYANTGLINAFKTAGNLANTTTGAALATTPNGNGVVPQSEINAIANILVSCVNSSSNSSSSCTTLFGDLQGSPTNTLLAALSMALHPGYNASTLFGLAAGTASFQPALTSAPNDWTVALSFNSGGSSPRSLAIDSLGDVWAANLNSGGTSSRLSQLSATGVPINGSPFSTNLNGTTALAIDDLNQVWVGNSGNGTLCAYSSNGGFLGGLVSGLNGPMAMAFDSNGVLWVADNGNSSVAEINTGSLSFVSPAGGYTGGGISTPFAIAVDGSGNVWVGNSSTVTELSNSGTPSGGSPYSSGGITSPSGIAVDGSNNIWETNNPTGGVVAELNSSGTALSGSGYTGGGVGTASGIAIDGGGNVWIADRALNRLSELNSSGVGLTPTTGYKGGGLNAPKSLAIDGAGNVWVANLNSTTTGSITTTISEFVGVAAPTIEPLVLALEEGQIGKPPGTPIPVSIASGAVPYYSPGVAYSAQLYAFGGNSGSFVWSQTLGSLPSPLAINSTGLISGTTSLTGTYNFTVQACDASNLSNCTTQSYALSANTTIPVAGNEIALKNKSYAMQFSGFKNGNSPGIVYGSDFVASVMFDGAGGITGEVDSNNYKNTTVTSTALTGYYSYGPDNRGTFVIIPSGGKANEYAFSGGNFSGSTPQTLRFVEFDDTVPGTSGNGFATGAGIGKLQSSGAFVAATLNQSFVFGLQGETPCTFDSGVNPTCATISPFGPLSVAGKITGNGSGSITFGEEDAAGVNTSYNGIAVTGSYTNPDSSGRGTLTLTASGTLYPAPPSHFIYYIVNSGEMYVMSSDGHASTSLLSGDLLVQSGSFTNSTLSGNYVAYEEGGSNGDGVSYFPNTLDGSLIYLSVQAGPQFALTIDENNGQGQVKTEQSQGPFPYSIDSNGRVLISGGPIFYLANSGLAFGTEQPSSTNQGGPALITVQQQVSGTYGCGLTTGIFDVGTPQAPIPVDVFSGYSNFSTATIDTSSPDGVLNLGQSGTVTCVADGLTATTGRFVLNTTFGSNEVGYIIVPNSKYVIVPNTAGDSVPAIITVEK